MARTAIYLSGPAAHDSRRRHLVPDAAVRGDLLFTGGIAGFDSDGNLPDTHEVQAEHAYERLGMILERAGMGPADIGHFFVWSPDRHGKIGPINPHWERWFPDITDRPARHAIARNLDPGMFYRIEIVARKNAPRRSIEVDAVRYHTGGTTTPGFMPWGTAMGDLLFTGPTYGLDPDLRKMGEDADAQATLCRRGNADLYARSGHTEAGVLQMFVWYHDDDSRAAAMRATDAMYPNRNDRPAIHYVHSPLPFFKDVNGQFLIQYDNIVAGEPRMTIEVPGVVTLDGTTTPGATPAGAKAGNLLFTSLCLGSDRATGEMLHGLAPQARHAFSNALAVVEAGGFDANDVGHAYVWYADHASREAIDEVWEQIFPDPDLRPTRHCLVGNLPAGVHVGVELTAAR
jgi:2-iminobutanoate/2-iminopropanoate deaminase